MPRLKSVRGSVVAAAGDHYGIDHGQIAVASVALAALGSTSFAEAHGRVSFSVGANVVPAVAIGGPTIGPVYYPPTCYPPGTYVEPAHTCVQPPPIYVTPAPVSVEPMVYPPSVRYAAPVYYRRGSANERAARHQARNQDTLETSMLRNLSAVIVTSLTVAVLAGCGGGGSDAALDLGVVIAGQPGATVYAGQPSNIILAPGQSIELDASEPVIWNFSVNGSPLFDSGTTVVVQGLEITQSDLSASRVVLDTFLSGPTQLPVFVTLTATSTIDAALVATVTLQIQ